MICFSCLSPISRGLQAAGGTLPVFITLEVICELILPLIMAEIVDVAIPAGDTAYIFRLGAVMLALSLLSMAFGVLSAKYATFASQGLRRQPAPVPL